MKKPNAACTTAIIAALALSGCAGAAYLEQSASGHLELLAKRQSVEKLSADPKQPEALRTKMTLARDIRQFAVDELDLPDNKSYKSYVDVGRDYVTVAVFAAPEFSLFPQAFCFPIFGCVPYQAHFSLDVARQQSTALKAQGFDVHLTGVTAYSTLGWTADPLLNTMLTADETRLPAVVFHELAHQKVYIKNDTPFNEAFAVAVERTGVKRWLEATGQTVDLRDYGADDARAADFKALLDETRDELSKIFASDKSDAQKRAEKQAAFQRLRTNFAKLRNGKWGGYDGYDGWFRGEINNAKIAATGVYSDLVPDFLKLFEACGENYPEFYEAVERLGKVAKDERIEALKRSAC